MCKYYANCEYCANYHPDNDVYQSCSIFGPPIGDGSPFCNYFSCNVDECKRTECISYEELDAKYNGY